jgi:XTP/dITP diphosphohydrolase
LLTVLLTSPRVAPGQLTLPAWDELRAASRVLVASADHPLLPFLAKAGIGYEVTAEPGSDGVWLNEPGDESVPDGATPLRGSRDLPGARLLDLVATMDTLRRSCPWDARQTHQSLAPHLLEEPYEALEALETGDDKAFREELGDVLLQVVFHARIAAERPDGYTIDDVADGITAKLVRRHPHVFADVHVDGAEDVKRNWDEIKKMERASASPGTEPSVLDGVPFGQPALALADQLQRRAARAGAPDTLGTVGDDLGDRLLRLVAQAREAGLDPELELRAAARRYRDLVRDWELSRRDQSHS